MASNFDFLRTTRPAFLEHAAKAELLAHEAPRASCFYARFTLEIVVHWMYEHDAELGTPYDHQLGALVHEQSFRENLPKALFEKVRTILKVGNHAAHDRRPLTARDSVRVVEELFHFLYWVCRVYADDGAEPPKVTFDPKLIPSAERQRDLSREQIEALERQLARSDEMVRIEAERRAKTEAEIELLKAQIAELKKQNQATPDAHDYNEAETRDYFIDLLLKEAGWPVDDPSYVEVPVTGMPADGKRTKGNGFVDYVLWGDDGKPLGIAEAKRTKYDALKGEHQAELYADCLEKEHGRRPVIFLSNGYEHWIWDDLRYPRRPVDGFYTKPELELIHHRREHAKKLHLVQIDSKIVERSYQHEAIRRITQDLARGVRRALLVMATGTGKTRTAIALVDVLRRADWVKRVLFLADRNALLTQAKRAFKAHLPTATAIDITRESDVESATVVLSTYPTMLNRIDEVDDGRRIFGPGSFDLVIVDEAHRSIYQKYAAIFDYFDALLVGLTATPRDEVHRDTYRVFDLEPGVPTFAYELKDAIEDKVLVPPRGVRVPFKFLQQGVTYAELSDEEKEEYEEKLADEDTGVLPDHVDAAALNRWLFNENTVDKAIEHLMEKGLRVQGGDRIGKTIVFARNHEHATFFVDRFNKAYPQYANKLARVIDSHHDYAQHLLDEFSEADKDPAIAVSVDMLDTGVDIPEVANLVFFKPVRSRVKFNQMIGRGTRLCPDLFGPGQDKTHFLVFDLCGNFEFFSQSIDETDPKPRPTLTEQLVNARVDLAVTLDANRADDEEVAALRASWLDALHEHVATMSDESFLVRRQRRVVEEFSDRARWDRVDANDRERIAHELAPLPNGLPPEDPNAKQFDLLCYRVTLARLQGTHAFTAYRDKIIELAGALEEKQNIPMVREHIVLIQAIQDEDYWADITLPMIEQVRRALRGLVQLIDRRRRAVVYTAFDDSLLGEVTEVATPLEETAFSPWQYRKKVEAHVRANERHIAIAKLKRNQPLTPTDLSELERMLFNEALGTRKQFQQVYGKDVSLPRFIREIVGLDRAEAKAAFAKYLDGATFSANQIRFVETIIDYLTQNGWMDPALLWDPPFSDLHDQGVDGIFPEEDAGNIVAIVRSFSASLAPAANSSGSTA